MRALAILAMAISLSGCLMPNMLPIDYTPAATVQSAAIPEKEVDRILVSMGPRGFLDNLTRRIADENARLAAVDRLTVRDALFPQGGWRLSALLATAPSAAVRAQVDYLVLVHGPAIQRSTFGERGDLSAFVLDVSTHGFPVGYRVRSETNPMKFILFEPPNTKKALARSVAHAVAEYMLRAHPDGTVRFVVMAAETPSEPVWQSEQEAAAPIADPTAPGGVQ